MTKWQQNRNHRRTNLIKKSEKVKIKIIGGNAENVTGSASLITFKKKDFLFEFGMIQRGKNTYENYCMNRDMVNSVKATKIQYIFLGHNHADHIGNVPALYGRNCKATIIVPKGSYPILKEMWKDSAFINQRDADFLTIQKEKNYSPIFTEEDVDNALSHVKEYDFHTMHTLEDGFQFRFSYAGHILFSAQTELFLTSNNHTKKILFTSDLGNKSLTDIKPFVEQFEPVTSSNIVIGEATYAVQTHKSNIKQDISKIQTVINQFCEDQKGIVLIPCFALDRLPFMLWLLYSSIKDTNVPIIVDSPLGIRLLEAYQNTIPDYMKEKLEELLQWKNIKFITDVNDSKAAVADGKPKVVLASSGMLTAGRSVSWVKSVIEKSNNCILFIGYTATNTLAYKIKNGKTNSQITINGKICKNNAQIVDLHSFSSHMQHDDLLKYYAGIKADKIYLVHSEQENKLKFKKELEERIRKNCKTTKVVAVNSGTIITL